MPAAGSDVLRVYRFDGLATQLFRVGVQHDPAISLNPQVTLPTLQLPANPTNSANIYSVLNDGVQTLLVRSLDITPGDFSFRLHALEPVEQATLGAVTSFSSTLALGDVKRYRFDATQGQVISLELSVRGQRQCGRFARRSRGNGRREHGRTHSSRAALQLQPRAVRATERIRGSRGVFGEPLSRICHGSHHRAYSCAHACADRSGRHDFDDAQPGRVEDLRIRGSRRVASVVREQDERQRSAASMRTSGARRRTPRTETWELSHSMPTWNTWARCAPVRTR